jgi:hypothetical protein
MDPSIGDLAKFQNSVTPPRPPSDDLQCCKDVENADKDMYQPSLRSMSALGMLLRTTPQHLNPGETVPAPPLSNPAVE